MSPTSHLRELDLLRKQVADLTRELRDRDQIFRERTCEIDEVQDLRERSDMLRAIVTSTASETGENFFPTLVCHLSSVLGVQYVLVGEVQESPIRKIRTIAVSAGGGLVDNFEYPLMNTPCETALGQSFACFERDVRTVFPLFGRLAQLGVEGYCGTSLRAKDGAVNGLLVLMDTKPLRNTDRLRSLMAVFASRAGAELQRRHSETRVQQQQRQLMEAQARVHLGSWDWDLDSGAVHWSEEQFRIFGYEPGCMAVSYDTFVTALHPLDRERVRIIIDTALKSDTTYDVECRIVRPDRTIRAIHCRGEVCRDVDGRPVSLSNSVLDITDRQRVEEELRLSQGRLQQALRASGTGLWNWNTETNEVVFSEEWKRQVGYSGMELANSFETWTTLLHPDDREAAVAYARQYRTAPDGDYRQEFRLRHKDGTYRWIEARASFVTEADGRRIHLLGSHTDMTDRKRMEQTIRESEERYRTLVELSPSGVFVFCEGRTVYVNRTGALLMGAQDPQEILDRPTFEFIHPDYHQEVRDSVTRLLGGGVSLHSAERVYVRLDGTTIPVQVEAGRITWDGKPAILGMFSDITERKQAEQTLRTSEERFAKAFRASPHPIGITEVATGRCIEVNDACLQLFGFRREEVIGNTTLLLGIWPNRGDRAWLIERLKAGEPVHNVEMNFKTKTGDLRHILVSSDLAELNGTMCLISVGNDITERKRAEEERKKLLTLLTNVINAMPELIFVKDQDLRTMLCNNTFAQAVGKTPEDMIGRTDLENGWDPELVRGNPDKDIRGFEMDDRKALSGQVIHNTADPANVQGEVRIFDTYKVPLRSETGDVMGVLGIARDITERKWAEEALRESKERYRTLYDETPSMYFTVDGTGVIESVNQYGAQYLGYRVEDLVGKPVTAIFFEEDRDRVCAQMEAFFHRPEGVAQWEFRKVKSDGAVLWVREHVRVLQSRDGEPLALVVCEDITEQKRTEDALANLTATLERQVSDRTEALRQSEERFRQFFDHAPNCKSLKDKSGRYLYTNRRFEKVYGLAPGTALAKTDRELFAPELAAEFQSQDDRVLSSGLVQEFEEVTQQEDGPHTSIVVKFPVTDASGELYAIGSIATDITERKRILEQLKLYQEILTHSINGIAIINTQGRYLQQNRAHEQILGYSTTDLAGKTPAIYLGEEVFARIGRTLATVGSYRAEVESRTKSGAMLALDLTAFTVKDAEGQPVCYVSIVRDVTERNRAQEALRESEARWQQFAESVSSAFWIADVAPEQRQVLYVNSAFTFIWGIEREEIYHDWSLWLESIHPDDHLRVKASHDRFIAGGASAVFHCEYRIVGRDGHIRWISDRRVRMAGWKHRIAGIAEDITHHKQQLALMAQTESIGKIGGWQFDFLTDRLWWSDETYRLHDTTPEVFSPTVEAALNFYTPESRPIIAEAWLNGVTQGRPWDLELELHTVQGRRIAVRATGKVDVLEGRAVRAYGTFQDITERKRAEEALQRAHDELERKVLERTAQLQTSEERYARATAVGKVGVWELDVLKGHYYGDANLKMLFGYGQEELSTDPFSWLKLVHPDDQAVAMKSWEQVQSGSTDECHYELRVVRRDGSVIWTDVRGHGIRDSKGRLTHLIGATVDITERKLAEQTLSESEARVRTLVANIPGAIYRCAVDREWTMSYLSDAIESIVGYQASEFIANHTRSYASVIHPDDRQLVEEVTWTSLEEHRPYVIEYRLVHANGTVRWVYEKGQGLFGSNGEVRFLDGAIFDITERKQAEQALRESEERFSKAFRTSPHPIGITEAATGRCIEVNDACLELFGFRREEVIGNTTLILGIWPHPDDRTRVIERLKSGQAVHNMEFALRTKTGAVRYLLASADLAELNGTLCVVTIANDITDRKQAEEALRISEERFAKAFQASPHPVVISDLDSGLIVDANEAAWQLFGYCKEEVVGHSTLQIGLWHSLEERTRYLELLKRQGSIRNMEVQLRSKNGDIRQCLLSSELIELNGKQCTVTVGDDVTESRRLEKALRLTQFSVDQAVEAILWLDPNARVFSANDAACRMFEYPRKELLGMTIHDIDPNFPVERWLAHWNYLKQQGALTFEAKFWSRTGIVLETDVTVNYLQHEGKEYACMILRDIGERKRAEAELRRSHAFLRQVIDTDPNFIFAKDRDGRFTMVNKSVADCYGTTVENLIGKSDADFNSDAAEVEFFRQKDREVMNFLEERFIPEEKITDSAGKTRWLQTVKRPILDDGGQAHMVLGAATDITERKRMEEMLLQRERDLSAALQERERISQDLHDGILQALYAVGLGLEGCKPLIRQQPGPIAAKFMKTLDQGIGQLNQVMGEVRNFIAGLESHVIQGGDFPTALRNLVATMASSASAKCQARIDEGCARQLSTEQALHLINIVREGVSNALRHSGATRITVSLRDLARSVRLTITDNGVGFNMSSAQGVGHGLSNMAARAQKVRGVFSLQSTPRKGTKISLDLSKDVHHAHN